MGCTLGTKKKTQPTTENGGTGDIDGDVSPASPVTKVTEPKDINEARDGEILQKASDNLGGDEQLGQPNGGIVPTGQPGNEPEGDAAGAAAKDAPESAKDAPASVATGKKEN